MFRFSKSHHQGSQNCTFQNTSMRSSISTRNAWTYFEKYNSVNPGDGFLKTEKYVGAF